MKLLKDYDCTIEYYPSKVNIVVDALSRKLTSNLYYICTLKMPLLVELRKLDVKLFLNEFEGILATLKVRPMLIEKVVQAQ